MIDCNKNGARPTQIHAVFNNEFKHIHEFKSNNSGRKDSSFNQNLDFENFKPICFKEINREALLQASSFNATYDQEASQEQVDK